MKSLHLSIRRQILFVGIATALILTVPLVAMQFSTEVNWTLFDFAIAFLLLFGTGLTFVLIARRMNSNLYKAAVGIAVLTGLTLIWVNLAVGIIGSENNPANQLYGGVLLVGFIGAVIARLRPSGMMRALYATAIAQFLVPVIALMIWRPSFDDPPGMIGVFVLNAFFAALFVSSALLFQRAEAVNRVQK